MEARFDFSPGWYVAGRVGAMDFGEIVVDPGSGETAPWDQDIRRTELALGYRLAREALVKLNWQRNTVPTNDFEQNVLALQLSTAF